MYTEAIRSATTPGSTFPIRYTVHEHPVLVSISVHIEQLGQTAVLVTSVAATDADLPIACKGSDKPDRDSLIDYESLETAVPSLQRPVNELQQVKEGTLFSWATLEGAAFALRLGTVFAVVFAFLGGPIAYQTFDPSDQLPQFVLAGSLGALLVTTVITLRIYLGWAYVGERLLSATIEYEETGWYDGQQFVKPPEVLARDRLLGTYEVTPVMRKLRKTMLGTGVGLLASAVLLVGTIRASTDDDGMYGRGAAVKRGPSPTTITNDGIIYSKNVTDLSVFMEDDFAAAEEQAALNGMPGYCGDRYYKAKAGAEELCAKFQFKMKQ